MDPRTITIFRYYYSHVDRLFSYNNQIQPHREDYVKMSKHKKQERQKNVYILYTILYKLLQ